MFVRFLAPLLFASLLLAAAPALARAKPPTPELIERAEQRGQLGPSKADLYRAYALAAPERLPAAFRSAAPWDGTLTLLEVRRDLPRLREAARDEIQALLAPPAPGPSCSSSSGTQANALSTTHFHITYDGVDAGLTAAGYAASLEGSWQKEVDSFGWAAPPIFAANPAPGNRYPVRIDDLGPGLYGFVSAQGTHAGLVGNNPATAWDDADAYASCMVLNRDYSGFPSTPQASLDSTTAHEFNHSIQFGYGALSGPNLPDNVFVEGGATWMEDEVHDTADDNRFYLWPAFRDSMGDYDNSPYPYWITFRGMTERYGAGSAGGAEQVMQDFWELTSQNAASNQAAMAAALGVRGTTLADAFHAYAVAAKFNRACAGGYAYPYCFEEGAGYVAIAGATAAHATVASVGASATSSVEDNHALAWVALPSSAAPYDVTLSNTSAGGQLRGTVACDTGSGLQLSALPSVAASGQSSSLVGFNPAGCAARVLVVTNQSQTADNPTSSASRSFTVSTAGASPTTHLLSVAKIGSGSGTVTSNPAGINCGSDCSQSYTGGTVVTLAATPAAGSSFSGWSGTCSGTSSCTVTMSESRSVTAGFDLVPDVVLSSPTQPPLPTEPPVISGLDTLPPAIASLRLSPSVFRAARSGPALSALVGTRISLALSEAATVTFRVTRLVAGRRVGGRCVRPTMSNRSEPRCTRSVRQRGRIVRELAPGTTRLRYRGRLAGRTLPPSRYRLLVRARDAAGNLSSQRRASFLIVR